MVRHVILLGMILAVMCGAIASVVHIREVRYLSIILCGVTFVLILMQDSDQVPTQGQGQVSSPDNPPPTYTIYGHSDGDDIQRSDFYVDDDSPYRVSYDPDYDADNSID